MFLCYSDQMSQRSEVSSAALWLPIVDRPTQLIYISDIYLLCYVKLGKGAKKIEKKLTNVSFMYVCVAGNGEMLVFFSFFPPTIV